MNPQIQIKYSHLLHATVSRDVYELRLKKIGLPFPSKDEVKDRVASYTSSWQAKEGEILPAMSTLFHLDFRQSEIDVYVAPFVPHLSDPIMLGIRNSPDVFVDNLTHELFHRLFTENIQQIDYGELLEDQYGDYPHMVKNHVFVHAGLKAIYLDILKEPARLKADIERHQRFPEYTQAWEIVEKSGYKQLVQSFVEYFSL